MKTIIEMAREADIEVTYDPTETPTRAFAECWIEDLEHFAELVRAEAQAEEREACAKVCEKTLRNLGTEYYASIASDAIRERGNT